MATHASNNSLPLGDILMGQATVSRIKIDEPCAEVGLTFDGGRQIFFNQRLSELHGDTGTPRGGDAGWPMRRSRAAKGGDIPRPGDLQVHLLGARAATGGLRDLHAPAHLSTLTHTQPGSSGHASALTEKVAQNGSAAS